MAYTWQPPDALTKNQLDSYLNDNYGEFKNAFNTNNYGLPTLEDFANAQYMNYGRNEIATGKRAPGSLRESWTYAQPDWGYDQVMPEFEKYLASKGGATKANTDEAKNFLVAVGFDPAQIDQWYDQWKLGKTGGTSGGTTGGTSGGTTTSSSSHVNPATGTTTVNTNTNSAQTPTGDSFDPVAFNEKYQSAIKNIQTPEIERVVADTPNAKTFEVPYEQTSAGIMERLLASDSPYVKQARINALSSMNDRGLLSSSLAAGAGEEAAIGRAFDVGSRDAGIYGEQRIANMDAINNMANANANRTLDAGKTNAGAFNTLARDKFTSQLGASNKAFDTALDITKAKVNTELGRGDKMLDFELGNLNAQRDNAYKRGDMELAAKLDIQIDSARQGLSYQISNWTSARDNAYKQGDMRLAADLDTQIDNARQNLAYEISNLTSARDNAYKQGDMRLAGEIEKDIYESKAILDSNLKSEFARLQSQLDYDSKASLAAIEHNYGQASRYSTSAANLMIAMFQSINLILADPNMDQGNKQGVIDQVVNNYNGIMEGLASMVVPDGEG